MKKLLKADFYKATHSKLLLFTLLGGLVFCIVMAFFYKLIDLSIWFLELYSSSVEGYSEELDSLLQTLSGLTPMLTGKLIFVSTIPFGESYGIILAVIICVYISTEFRSGVMRNKIISGAKRSHIYLSTFIVCSLITTIIMLITWLFNLLICTTLFKWGTPIDFKEFGYIIGIIGIALLVYLFYTAIIVLLSVGTRSMVLSMIMGVVIPMIGTTIFSLFAMLLSSLPKFVLQMFCIFPSMQTTLIAGGTPLSTFAIISVIANLLWIVLFTFAGIRRFKKAELK